MEELKHFGYPGEHPAVPVLRKYVNQFLVHSFLYYTLDESIISDHQYDFICKKLSKMVEEFPDMEVPHIELARGVEKSGSGFYISNYPANIQATAFRLLWWHKRDTLENYNEDFQHFLSRWGKHLER